MATRFFLSYQAFKSEKNYERQKGAGYGGKYRYGFKNRMVPTCCSTMGLLFSHWHSVDGDLLCFGRGPHGHGF